MVHKWGAGHAHKLLKEKHINDILKASYSHLIVDEYQDCSKYQHAIVYYASRSLNTCVLGDPLQAIFNFGSDGLADWEKHVCQHFPIHSELDRPWRWINAGCESFGRWLLEVREKLISQQPIDLSAAPSEVQWIKLDGNDDHTKLLKASRVQSPIDNGNVVIIGESINADSRYRIASAVHGAVTIEAVDLRDLTNFANRFEIIGNTALADIASFAQSLMTNVGANDLVNRVQSLMRGTARKEPNDVENTAIKFVQQPTYQNAVDLLVEINKQPGVRTYRPALLRACIKAMQLCISSRNLTFIDAAIRIREQNRILGVVSKKVVHSHQAV